ncbi:hypothetical protein FKM82_023697 [Ascaphus truei]
MEIRSDAAVFGVVGQSVRLRCSFSTLYPTSDRVTVNWSFRPENGDATITIFHFQSVAYPSTAGHFQGRVTWDGDVGRGDGSIALRDLRLTDNGTLTCTVRNPPDVQGNVPQTKLTVTVESIHFQFSTATLLAALVLTPAALVALLLLVRMTMRMQRGKSGGKKRLKSPIEESQE